MKTSLEDLEERVDKLEDMKKQELLTLVELLSNVTFFGELKKATCEYAKDGQCSFFVLDNESVNKIPIVSECRVSHCEEPFLHFHIELSNITCTLCQRIHRGQ
jgi:hypothetical protein